MKKLAVAVVAAALVCALSGPGSAALILFIGDNPPTEDVGVVTHLETTLGHTITSIDDDDAVVADAVGMDLVIVSSTVSSGDVNAKFTDQDPTFASMFIPTIQWEQALNDDYLFSDDGDTVGDQNTVTITAAGASPSEARRCTARSFACLPSGQTTRPPDLIPRAISSSNRNLTATAFSVAPSRSPRT